MCPVTHQGRSPSTTSLVPIASFWCEGITAIGARLRASTTPFSVAIVTRPEQDVAYSLPIDLSDEGDSNESTCSKAFYEIRYGFLTEG